MSYELMRLVSKNIVLIKVELISPQFQLHFGYEATYKQHKFYNCMQIAFL